MFIVLNSYYIQIIFYSYQNINSNDNISMHKNRQINTKTIQSPSVCRKSEKNQSSRIKHVKPRQHQAIRKFNKTINELKKPKNAIQSNTLRSKTPSPLKQIKIAESSNFMLSSLKQIKEDKIKDEKFIQSLFNSAKDKKKEKKNNNIENIISKAIKQQNLPKNKSKNKQNQCKQQLNVQQYLRYQQIISEKNYQIKMLTNKLKWMQQGCQKLTLTAFDIVSLIRKIQSQNQIMNIKMFEVLMQKKLNSIIENINFFITKLKLQGKIKLKSNILQNQFQQIFQGRSRAITEGRVPVLQYLHSLATNKYGMHEQKHHRSQSSQPKQKKNQEFDILIDIISRRESIASSRKDEDKKIVIKQFQGSANAHQLILHKGETVTVLKKSSNELWIGIKDGIVGYFPKDCVQ